MDELKGPPDRSWVEFGYRWDAGGRAWMFGPLVIGLCIVAIIVVCHG